MLSMPVLVAALSLCQPGNDRSQALPADGNQSDPPEARSTIGRPRLEFASFENVETADYGSAPPSTPTSGQPKESAAQQPAPEAPRRALPAAFPSPPFPSS